jgi:uncharacterized membrane protein
MTSTKFRITSIDLLRGAVMLLMALDHARDFLHFDFFRGNDPLDFATTSTPLFLTRWITHFCAPVFVFLAGASIFFSGNKKSKSGLSLFLLTRGLWLMLLEVTIITFGWMFSMEFKLIFLQVIWAIGLSMVCMSVFVFLPRKIVLLIGLLLVFGHNLLDSFHVEGNMVQGFLWSVLHETGKFRLYETHTIFVGYPLLPWLGLMMTGFAFGQLYLKEVTAQQRKRRLIIMGTSCIALFAALRSGNFYGDAWHWKEQNSAVFTALSFIDCTKYPPSLLYLLMTIGPALLFLAFAENLKGKLVEAVSIIGRVPLFYYVVHLYVLHLIAGILFFATGHSLAEINFAAEIPEAPENFGLHLWQVYLVWLFAIGLLYFPCKWYNRYKSTHSQWWLSYL